jgi:hypothetical protein
MGAIIMCTLISVLAVGLYIFDHTETGRNFFERNR